MPESGRFHYKRRRRSRPGNPPAPAAGQSAARIRVGGPTIAAAVFGAFGRALRALPFRSAGALATLGVAIAVVAYVGYSLALDSTTRTLNVCAVSDYPLRTQRPAWDADLKRWVEQLNVWFAPGRVRFQVMPGGDAYPERTAGTMAERQELAEMGASCNGDVLLVLTGQSDPNGNSNVSPFGKSVILAPGADTPDALVMPALARVLAGLFGAPAPAQLSITTDTADGSVFDRQTVALIRDLHRFDFRRGLSDGTRWHSRALAALTAYFQGRSANPEAMARKVVAEGFAGRRAYAAAANEYARAIALLPNHASFHFARGLVLQADSRSEEALQELAAAARLDPDDASIHAAAGVIRINRNQMEEAGDELKTATRLDPRNPVYQAALGHALSARPGQLAEAQAAFELAARLRPRDDDAAQGLGGVLAMRQNSREFLRDIEAEVKQTPNSAEAHLRLAAAYVSAGELDTAETEVRRAIQLDPSDGLAHVALARLKYLKSEFAAANAELDTARAKGLEPALGLVNAIRQKLARN